MDQYLIKRLKEYGDSDFYPFHMPGHKRQWKEGFAEGFPNPFSIDITEIDGFDNLHHPEGILKESMELAAEIYGADRTYYLVNGSSCGILSAIFGTVTQGGTILMSRNCHKSAYHGACMNHLRVEYIYPQIITGYGIQGGLSPADIERLLISHPETQAVLIVSPTYDGIVSDIQAIAQIVHRRRIPLIVDEAHGAHFSFGRRAGFPHSALELGADVVIQSLHKTLPSFTQTAVMHVKEGFADFNKIDRYVSMFQSSSPSYVLMAGIDNCIRWMDQEGEQAMIQLSERLDKLRSKLGGMRYLRLIGVEVEGKNEVYRLDRSKLTITVRGSGMTGPELGEWLRRDYHLEMEMCGSDYVTAITTLADSQEGFDRLCRSLLEIDKILGENRQERMKKKTAGDEAGEIKQDFVDKWMENKSFCGWPHICMTIAEAMERPGTSVPIEECSGMISAEFIYLYPPGIPIVTPGELLKPELVELVKQYKQYRLPVQGTVDPKVDHVIIVKQ